MASVHAQSTWAEREKTPAHTYPIVPVGALDFAGFSDIQSLFLPGTYACILDVSAPCYGLLIHQGGPNASNRRTHRCAKFVSGHSSLLLCATFLDGAGVLPGTLR